MSRSVSVESFPSDLSILASCSSAPTCKKMKANIYWKWFTLANLQSTLQLCFILKLILQSFAEIIYLALTVCQGTGKEQQLVRNVGIRRRIRVRNDILLKVGRRRLFTGRTRSNFNDRSKGWVEVLKCRSGHRFRVHDVCRSGHHATCRSGNNGMCTRSGYHDRCRSGHRENSLNRQHGPLVIAKLGWWNAFIEVR